MNGGNYGGHGSKAALNMTAKLLSIDLEKKGIAVSVVHTGYLRKQNPDGFFEKGGPDGMFYVLPFKRSQIQGLIFLSSRET
jgi:NAD(P)-dependent dehydrogenase (short-subunit alcohol dehydrogenase family)